VVTAPDFRTVVRLVKAVTLHRMRRYALALVLAIVVVLGGVYVASVFSQSNADCDVLPVPAGCPGYEIDNTDN
jgi:hypothetical protein